MNDKDERLTSWTLAAIKARGLAIEGYCQTEGCRQFYAFNLDRLIESAGGGYAVPEYLPGMTCKICGGPLKFMPASAPPAP